MEDHTSEIFILGATGFIGNETVKAALNRGFRVKALARDPEKATALSAAGAVVIKGDAASPAEWIHHAAGSKLLIDLIQPKLPARIGRVAVRRTAELRAANTRTLLASLKHLPAEKRPILLSVSGLDDLAPDSNGNVSDASPVSDRPAGFGHIGIPVRRLVEQSAIPAAFVYLATVYGPGKGFAKSLFPQLAAGRFRLPGDGGNRMPLVHVEDAARALVHIAALPVERLAGRSFVVADGRNVSMRAFLGAAAKLLGAPAPRTVPRWLARLALGSALYHTLTRDIGAVSTELLSSGFEFRYRSHEQGLPPTLHQLGLLEAAHDTN